MSKPFSMAHKPTTLPVECSREHPFYFTLVILGSLALAPNDRLPPLLLLPLPTPAPIDHAVGSSRHYPIRGRLAKKT